MICLSPLASDRAMIEPTRMATSRAGLIIIALDGDPVSLMTCLNLTQMTVHANATSAAHNGFFRNLIVLSLLKN